MKDKNFFKVFIVLSTIISIVFFMLPLLALIIKSKMDFLSIINNSMVKNAITISLKSTVISLFFIIIFGIPTAYFLERYKFKGKFIIELIIDLPMVLPPSVAGLLLLITFGRNGLIGIWLNKYSIQLPFSFYAVLIAQIFVAMPIFIRTVRTGIEAIDKDLEITAELLGDTKRQVFFKITLPLIKNSIITAAILSWARALGEFGATMMFAGNVARKTQTLPLAIYVSMEDNLYTALAIAVILIIICTIILVFIKFLTVGDKYIND